MHPQKGIDMPITRADMQQMFLAFGVTFDSPAPHPDARFEDGRLTELQHGRAPGAVVELLGAPEDLHMITVGVDLRVPSEQLTFAITLACPVLAVRWREDVQLLKWYMEQVSTALLGLAEKTMVEHPTRPIRLTCDKSIKHMMVHIGVGL